MLNQNVLYCKAEMKNSIGYHLLRTGALLQDRSKILKTSELQEAKRKTQELGYKWEVVIGRSRLRDVVDIRHLVFYYLYNNNWNYTRIGLELDRNHATVLHACKKVRTLIDSDKNFRNTYNKFMWI